jgi:hypothetical protein
MSAAWASSSVLLPDFARTTTFRWTLTIAGAIVLYTLVMFGFVYWQTAAYLISENDVLLVNELRVFADNTPEQRVHGKFVNPRKKERRGQSCEMSTSCYRPGR